MADAGKNTFLKYIVIILVIFMVNIFGGYFVAQKILNYTYNTDIQSESENKKEQGEADFEEELEEPGVMVPLDAINLNPANSSGEIFSCDIVLEVKDDEIKADIDARNPQIMDKLSSYLALKTVQELADAQKWELYRREMTELINSLLSSGKKISNLYIKQKIIQFE